MLERLAPLGLGRDLGTTIYATLASLQLLAAFALWTPSGVVWWRAGGDAAVVLTVCYAASWLLLLRAMADAGLAVQTGFLGWGAVVRGQRPRWKPFSTDGLFRFTRQPVYLAFALTLWTAPVWTPDRLLLATVWTAYCVLGPLHKERRYRAMHGEAFLSYQQRVPYWLPRLRQPGLTEAPAAGVDAPSDRALT